MTTKARLDVLERRADSLKARVTDHDGKFDPVLQAVVDVHSDVTLLRQEIHDLRTDLPDIIARAVAPLLVRREED